MNKGQMWSFSMKKNFGLQNLIWYELLLLCKIIIMSLYYVRYLKKYFNFV